MSPRFNGPPRGVLAALLTILVISHVPEAAHAQVPAPETATFAEAAETPPLAHQIGFFRQFLSRADGDRCSMHPSCSTFALQSLRKHGALVGWVMASDRLLRCGHDEIRLAPKVRQGQRRKAYDPVSGNDFWWWTPPEAAAAGP